MNNNTDKGEVLCIDCDGTLLRTDLLHEAVLLLLKQAPFSLVFLPWWLLRGKAYLKDRIAERVSFDWATLPYCSEILEIIHVARQSGRKVILVTASPQVWADGLAEHLRLFDGVVGSKDGVNLSGVNKAVRLEKMYGAKGFDYAGNGYSDLPIWKVAKSGIVVSTNSALIESARRSTLISHSIALQRPNILDYLRGLRIHQWLKNGLVFVPLLAAHKIAGIEQWMLVFFAFMSFSLCASAVYVLNDLLDLESDRKHIRKSRRPFASALIPVAHGVFMVPILLIAAIWLAVPLPLSFSIVLVSYFVMTLAYSLRLKRQVIVDVMLLAALYTMRIIAGGAATNVVPSFWLLAFSMFVFLSLAIVKRYSELYLTLQQQKVSAHGRGYSVNDLQVLVSIGAGAGVAAVLVLALYINDPETARLYPEKMWLWLVPPIMLYWISRVWLKTCRGEIDDDPVVFAIKDWQSLFLGFLLSICFVLAAGPILEFRIE